MTKIEFLLALSERLSGLPKEEKLERLNFYSEMIEDRIEEGLSEEEAVAAVGTIDELIALDHPWIEEYFKGPRGRAAIAAKGEVTDMAPRSAEADAARHPTEVEATSTGQHSQGTLADAHARGEPGTR